MSLAAGASHSLSTQQLAVVLEQALHARVLQRCRRALLHEIRNGLQPLHAGVEALNRVINMTPLPHDKAQRYVQLLRQASASQEIAFDRAIERIAPENVAPQEVDAAAILREVTRFLSSDAAVAGVRMQLDVPGNLMVHACPHQVRLIALSLILDAIDRAAADGQLTITGHATQERVLLQFSDTRALPAGFDAEQVWASPPEPSGRDYFHLGVIRMLLEQAHGDADCIADPGMGYSIVVTWPAVAAAADAPA